MRQRRMVVRTNICCAHSSCQRGLEAPQLDQKVPIVSEAKPIENQSDYKLPGTIMASMQIN